VSQSQPTQTPTAPALYLLDTNILARLTETASPMHQTATDAVTALTTRGDLLFVTPQNFVEFWNLATRPADKNGFGLTTAQAAAQLATYETAFRLIPDHAAIFGQWKRLVSAYGVQGANTHDTRLAAVAIAAKVPNILTFNFKHFRRFAPEGLTAIDPATVPPLTTT
jgi:predicted nucleic acid-binding protein